MVQKANMCLYMHNSSFLQKTIRAYWSKRRVNQWFFSEPPQLIWDSHYMVLPQAFPYSKIWLNFTTILVNTSIIIYLFDLNKYQYIKKAQ